MKEEKKNWILEEIENKKNECLDADSFGGENPEDVEKQREKNDKEINKRFTGTKKNADKVVGEDHEEKGKPMKEYLKDKKDLSALLERLKKEDIHYTISRSDDKNYRFLVEYRDTSKSFNYKTIKVQFNEDKHNYSVCFNDGEVEVNNRKEAKELIESKIVTENTFEKISLEEDLPDAIPEEPIVISTEPEIDLPLPELRDDEPAQEVKENGIYMALSSALRDTLLDIENLKSLTVSFAEEGREDLLDDINSIIDDRTIHIGMLQDLMDKVDSKVEPTEVKEDEIVDDEEEIKEESLNEDRENIAVGDEWDDSDGSFVVVTKIDGDKITFRSNGDLVRTVTLDEFDEITNKCRKVKDGINPFYGSSFDNPDLFKDESLNEGLNDIVKALKKAIIAGDKKAEKKWRKSLEKLGMDVATQNSLLLTMKESLNEGHITNEYKGYELDWNEDSLDIENGNADLTVHILKNGKEVATALGFKEARKWVDDNGELDLPNKVYLEKPSEADYEGASEDVIADLEIMPHGEVTKEQWEDFLNKAQFPYWLDWEMLINEIKGGVAWGNLIEKCIKNLSEEKLQERGFSYKAIGYDDKNREVAWGYSYTQGDAEAKAKEMREKGTKGTIKSVVYKSGGNEPLATF